MFILKRHQNQKITVEVCGVKFTISVHELDRDGKFVRLGFDAPGKVRIDRAEKPRPKLRLVA